jgi:predicted DNA-binding protein with PD1-like motif
MKIKKQGDSYVAVLEIGEEFISSLATIAESEKIHAASIHAIGALRDFELGYYYLDRKEYGRKRFDEIAELISGAGNISLRNGKPFVHLHAVLGREDYSVIGGHLFSGIVAVTAEVLLVKLPERIERRYDDRTGLQLINLSSGKTL